jgi:lambda repressor-like predicted transcriptional regulator
MNRKMKNKDMTLRKDAKAQRKIAARVKYQLELLDMTQEDLARQLEVTSRWLRYVIREGWQAPEMQRRVAEALGVGFEELWGEGQ